MQLDVKVEVSQDYSGTGNGWLTVKNVTSQSLVSWTVQFTCENFKVGTVWQALSSMSGKVLIIKSADWNPALTPGASFKSGFDYTGSIPFQITNNVATNATINGIQPGGSTPPPPAPAPAPMPNVGREIAAYVTEWFIYQTQKKFDLPTMLPPQVNRLLYSFYAANPSQQDYDVLKAGYAFPINVYTPPPAVPEGSLVAQDTNANSIIVPQMQKLKQANPSLVLGIAIGGWSHSWNLGKVFGNVASTTNFVKSAITTLNMLGFDLLELDFESPLGSPAPDYHIQTPNDAANLKNVLSLLRAAFDASGRRLILGAAIPANKAVMDAYLPCLPSLNYVHVMCYDFYGSGFSEYGGHQSGLFQNPKQTNAVNGYSGDYAVQYMIANGCPANKILLGIPLYGRGWAKITAPADGPAIFGKSTGVGAKELDLMATPGVTSWASIVEAKIQQLYDPVAEAAYSYNSTTGEAWTFDNVRSVRRKAQYIAQYGLLGAAFWEISQDTRPPSDVNNLITTMYDAMNGSVPPPPPPATFQLQLANIGSAGFSLPPAGQIQLGDSLTLSSSSGFSLAAGTQVSF